jgi:hypothetical protein
MRLDVRPFEQHSCTTAFADFEIRDSPGHLDRCQRP